MTSVTNRRKLAGVATSIAIIGVVFISINWAIDPLAGAWVAECNGTTQHLFISRAGRDIRGFGYGSGRVLMTGESTKRAFAALSYSGRDTLIVFGRRPFFGKLLVTQSDGRNATVCSYGRTPIPLATRS